MNKQGKPWWDFRATFYLLGAVFILALRLLSTQWAESLNVFIGLAILATLLGIMLGYSRFPGWLAGVLSAAYGSIIIPWLFGLTLDKDISWYDRIVNILWFRLRFTIGQYTSGESVNDTILFVAILAVLFWVIDFLAGFVLVRKGSAWGTILPSGLALMLISFYDATNPATGSHIFFFMVFALLLVGRLHFLRDQRTWKQENIVPTPQAQQTLHRTLLIATATILLIAWLIPLTSAQVERYSELWKDLTEPWKKLQERISRIVEPVEYEATEKDEGFGISLNLGSRTALGTSTIFTVSSSQSPDWKISNYWKAQNYASYHDDQWFTGSGYEPVNLFPQSFNIPQLELLSREEITYTFDTQVFHKQNIFFVNTPDWISRPVQAYLVDTTDGNKDAISIFADPPLQSGEIYQVRALVGNPTRVDLRTSAEDYPDWLKRYLQLPDDLPPEIQQLAQEITLGQDNPFDKAQAITRYLRQNITYSESIPAIPDGEDSIAWFLFTHKAGFCNYYASAEVLMLRSIGIPARLAVGYAQGTFNEATGLYTVLQRDRHAWPEVYFNGYGWIEFEPTSAQPNIERPTGETAISTTEPTYLPEMDGEDTPTPSIPTPAPKSIETATLTVPKEPVGPVFATWLGIILLTLLTALFVFWLSTPQMRITPPVLLLDSFLQFKGRKAPTWLEKLAHRQAAIPFKRAYAVLARAIRSLGHPVNLADTPTERGEALRKLMPDLSEQIKELVHQYELARFSPHDADIQKANECSLIIQKSVQAAMVEKRLMKKRNS